MPDDPRSLLSMVVSLQFRDGWVAYREGRIEKALQVCDELLTFASLVQDERLSLRCQLMQAACFDVLGETKKALQLCIVILEKLDNRDYPNILAETYNHLGHINRHLGRYKTSLHYYELVIEAQRGIAQRLKTHDDSYPVDFDLIGSPFLQGVQLDPAILREMALIFQSMSIGVALMNAGIMYRELGDAEKSLRYLFEALSIHENVESEIKRWATKQDIVGGGLSDLVTAEISVEKGNVLQSIANVYYDRMEWEKALAYYKRALILHQSFADQGYLEAVAADYLNIGNVYASIAKTEAEQARAIDSFEKAKEICSRTGNKQGEATAYQNIAIAYGSMKRYKEQLDYEKRALDLFQATGDVAGETRSFTNIGQALRQLGDLDQALVYFRRSLAQHNEIGDRRGIIIVTKNIGAIMQEQLKFDQALFHYQTALTAAQTLDLPELVIDAYAQIGSVYQYQGDLPKAYANYAAAIKEMGRVRGKLKQIDFRIGVVARSVQVFERIVRVALDRKQVQEGYNRVEQAKSRTFLDLLGSSNSSTQQVDLTDVPPLGFQEIQLLLQG